MSDGSTVSELKGKISLDGAEEAKGTLDSLGKKTDDTGSSFTRALGSTVGFLAGFAGFGLAAGAVSMLTDNVGEWVKGAEDAQVMQAATNQILNSSSHVAGLTSDAVNNLATQTMQLTGVDDDLVHGAENILAGFGNISKQTFPDATQAATDMAISYKMVHGGQLDLSGSAQVLGRALQDPTRGARMLRQYNIILSQSQQEQIKHFMAVNDVAGAQAVIMDAVKDKVGGASDAFGSTAEGKMMRFHTAMDNIGKTIGGIVLPVMSGLMDAVNPLIMGFATDLGPAVQFVTDKVQSFMTYIQPLGTVFGQVYGQVSDLAGIFTGAFSQAFGNAGDSLQGIMPDMRDVANSIEKFVVHIGEAAKGPIGAFASALGSLVKGGIGLLSDVLHGDLLPNLQHMATTVADNLGPAIQGLAKWFTTSLLPAFQQALPQFESLADTIGSILVPAVLTLWQGFVVLESWLVTNVLPIIEAILPPVISFAGWLAGALTTGLKGATQGAKDMSPVLQAVQKFFGDMIPPLQQFAHDMETRLQPIIKNTTDVINNVFIPVIKAVINFIGPQIKLALDILMGVWNAVWPILVATFQTTWDTLVAAFKIVWDLFSGMFKVALDLLSGNWSQAWQDIIDTFTAIFGTLSDLGNQIMDTFKGALKTAGGKIGDALHTVWTDLTTDAGKSIQALVDGITAILQTLPKSFADAGTSMLQALVKAITDGAGSFGDAIKNMFTGAFKNFPGGGSLPGFADGTESAPGGLAQVGEGRYAELVVGPHIMNLPRGTGVYPVTMGGGGGGGGSGVTQHFAAGAIVINGADMSANEIYDAWQERATWLARGQGHG